MKIWLHKKLLNKYKEMEHYRITYIVAPWGSGKTSSLKYYMSAYSKNLRMYIDTDSIKGSSIEHVQAVIESELQVHQIKYLIVDHVHDEAEMYIEAFESIANHSNLRLILISDNIWKPQVLIKSKKILYISYEYYKYEIQDIMIWAQHNELALTHEECNDFYNMSCGWKSTLVALFEQYETFQKVQFQHVLCTLHDFFQHYKLAEYMRIFTFLSYVEAFDVLLLNELIDNEIILNCMMQIALSHFFFIEIKFGIYCMHETLKAYVSINCPLNKKQLRDVHRKLAAWFLKHQSITYAIYHYYKSEQYAQVLSLIKLYAHYNYIDEYPVLVSEVYRSIPFEILIKEPFTYLKITSDLLTTIDPYQGYMMFEKFKSHYSSGKIVGNQNLLQAEIYIIEGFVHFGNLDKMTYFFKESHTFFNGEKSRIAGNQLIITLGSPHILSVYYREGYTLSYLCKSLKESFSIYLDISNNNGMGMDIQAQAEHYFECRNVEMAKTLALKSKYMSEVSHQDAIQIAAIFLLARIAIYENDEAVSSSYILTLEKFTACQMLLYEAHCALGYLYVICNKKEKVVNWQKKKIEIPYDPSQYMMISTGLACLVTQEGEQANACALILLRKYEEDGSLFHKIYANLILCVIQGNSSRQMQYFNDLLHVCERDGIRMIFLEFQEYLYPCIMKLTKKDHVTSFEKDVVTYSLSYQKKKYLIHTLSAKEKEVFQCLMQAHTAKQIGEHLNISINTVNFHIKNIYRKLSVKNKAELMKQVN